MHDKALVSIVLPTYNGSAYIREALQSCIDQTYTNWELIVVNDASTDNTVDIVLEFAKLDARIRCISHEINRKLPAALNTGFCNAKGEFYTWTSDDNFYHPTALEVMVEYLVKNREVDLVYTDYTIINDGGNFIKNIHVEEPYILKYRCCIGACFLYHSYVDKKLNGYDESMFLVEDYEFWLRASKHFLMKPLHQNLYSYRRHDKSLTDLHNEKIFLLTRKAMSQSMVYKLPVYELVRQRPIYIWGTGNGGRFTLNWLSDRNISVQGFIDSNSEKWGTKFLNMDVVEPNSIRKSGFNKFPPFILIGSIYIDEIEIKLKELGYSEGKDYSVNFFFLEQDRIS